jgi:hypothetical protein
MKKNILWLVMLALALVFGMTLVGCGGDDDSSGGGGGNVGLNEVNGKTYYTSYSKTVFGSSTFDTYELQTVDKDTGEEELVLSAKGSYSYNSDKKTVTATVSQIMWEDAQGNPTFMTKTQAQNAIVTEVDSTIAEMKTQPLWLLAAIMMIDMGVLEPWDMGFEYDWETGDYQTALESWVMENESTIKPMVDQMLSTVGITTHEQAFEFMIAMQTGGEATTIAEYKTYLRGQIAENFNPRTFAYEITTDGALLGQQVYTNKGTDELKGKTYTLPNMMWGGDTEYQFAASGNTYSFTEEDYDFDLDEYIDVVTSGFYSYDSNVKTVWFRPTVLRGKTRAEFYDNFDADEYWGIFKDEDDAVKKASETNSYYSGDELTYDPENLTLSRKGWGPGGLSASKFSAKPSLFKLSQ